MKSPKGQGGVIEKRITKNVLRICTKMVYYWVEISESLDEINSVTHVILVHEKILPEKIKLDNSVFTKI